MQLAIEFLREHPRIAVVGTSASGKTMLARDLAAALRREHIELDALYWGPNWTPRPEFAELVEAAVAAESWVADGNYGGVRDRVWERASALIWLDYPFRVVFWRAVVRSIRRIVTREKLYSGNRESLRGAFLEADGIPWWVIRTHRRRRRQFAALLCEPRYRHLAVFRLRSPAEARAMLAGVNQ